MRKFIKFAIVLLVTTLLFAYKKYSITAELTGHLRNGKNSHEVLNSLNVIVNSNGKVLRSAITDKHGNFDLEFNVTSVDSVFRFYCYKQGTNKLLLRTVRQFENDTPEMSFYLPANLQALKRK